MSRAGVLLWLIIGVLQLALCSTGRAEVGKASYYCCRHNGRPTASGEHFNENALTAAHPYLRFGTRVRVCRYPAGHPCVTVRINDRGPARRLHRVIDLAKEPARRLGILARGTARVKVTVLR